MSTLIITGGRFDEEFAVSFLQKHSYNYVIAVDYGEVYARKLGLIPDMLVGDFDTRGEAELDNYIQYGTIIRKFIPEKDDTDTEIAVREACKRGEPVDILCGTGGRIDHLLANIHNLKIAMEKDIEARIIDRGNIVFLKDAGFSIDKSSCPGRYISFVPFDGEVTGIKLKGFKYPLNGYTLKPGISRCISNELSAQQGTVEFDSGCMIVVNSSDVESE